LTQVAASTLRIRFLALFLAVLPALGFAAAVTPSPSPVPPAPGSSPAPTPAVSGSSAAPSSHPSADAKGKSPVPDQWAEASRIFDQLSPDQKKKFLDNLDQWKAMSPEEQELFRDRELFRREKITAEIQDAVTKSGLHLDSDQREVFTLRYTQERRKIEEALHKEMDRKRQIMVSDMLSRLRLEFGSTPAPIVVPPDNPQLH
jgi:hypothetical protein